MADRRGEYEAMTGTLKQLMRKGWRLGAVAAIVFSAGALVRPTEAADPAARVIELTNHERARAGLAPLTYNPNLTLSAQTYAQVLAAGPCFGHTCGPIPYVVDRDEAAGYYDWLTVGENLAAGDWSPEQVVGAWMASPSHRANLLNPSFQEIGVGVAYGGAYGSYWTQEFGARSATPVYAWGPAYDWGY